MLKLKGVDAVVFQSFAVNDEPYLPENHLQGADKAVNLFWGIAADGSVMISDNVDLIKASCRKSFAPFPAGIMLI